MGSDEPVIPREAFDPAMGGDVFPPEGRKPISMSPQDAARLLLDPGSVWLPEDPAYDTKCSAAVRVLAQDALTEDEPGTPSHVEIGWGCDAHGANHPHKITTLSDDAVRHVGWVCVLCDREWFASSSASAATPEVVTGEEAAKLPEQSHVIVCREDGTIPPDVTAARVGDPERNIWGGWYRVLYRAPEPPEPLNVGNTVTTLEGLDALPLGATVMQPFGMPLHKSERGWLMPGCERLISDPALPVHVLDLPGGAS